MPSEPKRTFVYGLRCEGTEFVKIGRCSGIYSRWHSIQSCCPFELRLIFCIEAPIEAESFAHALVGHKRHRLEWFRLTDDEVVALLSALADKYPSEQACRSVEWLKQAKGMTFQETCVLAGGKLREYLSAN